MLWAQTKEEELTASLNRTLRKSRMGMHISLNTRINMIQDSCQCGDPAVG